MTRSYRRKTRQHRCCARSQTSNCSSAPRTRRIADEAPVILVLGASGQVGGELVSALSGAGKVVTPFRTEVDLENPASLRSAVTRHRPSLIVNAAAYTAVDRAETEPERCYAVNAIAPGALAEAARDHGAAFVHYSTDYVFDGTKGVPYVEDDLPAPVGVYATSKLEGERRVAAAGGAFLIFRVSWVFGRRGRNFMLNILSQARSRKELRVVDDQIGAPTWCRYIASATAAALIREDASIGAIAHATAGIYHLSAAGSTSWFDFATAIIEGDPDRHEHVCTSLTPVSSAEFPTAVPRPAFSVLDNAKLTRTFGIRLPEWREQLRHALGS